MDNPNNLEVISDIESSYYKEVEVFSPHRPFELKSSQFLISDLSGNLGALIIRALLYHLNIDEHRVLNLRLENKFRQYQVLDHYSPGCMPETLSFTSVWFNNNRIQSDDAIFKKGFFLKATLGDSSFSNNNWDKTGELDRILKMPNLINGPFEIYMFQKKLDIKSEFRVHSFNKEIIPGMTYLMQGQKLTVHKSLEKFLNEVLQQLPDEILQGTLIGWDVALTNDDRFFIIEANFTGFHPEYRSGFQTTGIVDNHQFGPIICAWINTYFRNRFGVFADSVEEELFVNHPFYQQFVFYTSIFKDEYIDLLKEKLPYAIMYLGDNSNMLVINLIRHFLLVNFATKYYVLVKDECFVSINKIFSTNGLVLIIKERSLFNNSQLQLVKQLGYDRRKQICSYRALRRIGDKSCIII